VLASVLAACSPGQPGTVAPGSAPPAGGQHMGATGVTLVPVLEAHRWQLESATDGRGQPIAAVSPGPGRAFVFRFSDGRLAIEGGCNRMTGAFKVATDGQLTVGRLASTNMACAAPLMQADAALSDILSRPMTLSVKSGAAPVLRLASADNAVLTLIGQLTAEARYGPGTRIFLEVAAQPVACDNPLTRATACLQVRERQFDAQGLATGTPGPWRPLFETIEGFTPEPGVRTVLRVNRYQRADVPPGGSALIYVLDLTVESELVSR
jgi:heat shock protein HslJ